jgi:plastocyanin
MSRRALRFGLAGSVLVVGLAIAVAAAVAGASTERSAPEREITLIVRDMAFFLPDSNRVNPTLSVAPGERVRIRLVNEEAGVLHDLLVEGLGFEIPPFREAGERSGVLVAPSETGRHEYVCSLHRKMMRGVLEVSSGGTAPAT